MSFVSAGSAYMKSLSGERRACLRLMLYRQSFMGMESREKTLSRGKLSWRTTPPLAIRQSLTREAEFRRSSTCRRPRYRRCASFAFFVWTVSRRWIMRRLSYTESIGSCELKGECRSIFAHSELSNSCQHSADDAFNTTRRRNGVLQLESN